MLTVICGHGHAQSREKLELPASACPAEGKGVVFCLLGSGLTAARVCVVARFVVDLSV